MPARADIKSVLVLGAGPIVIGQACEFDYSGTQACRALREEGIRVVLLNSNPATIMTDPDMADATYIEPVDADTAKRIIEKENIDAVLPTMGGQTALNCAMALAAGDVFGAGRNKDGKPLLIGASADSIHKAEDRNAFKTAMERIGLRCAPSAVVGDLKSARAVLKDIGFPIIIRPSFTLGGSGGGIAYNRNEFNKLIAHGLAESPTQTVLIERSLIGWKEFEMEVVRDCRDNCIIICSIENVDPMGIHTGDSITVAPAQTLTDKEYQMMRDASIAVLREIGVDTGGSNVQFAINPENGDMVVIEMNPRVSRSSALASKATGFPIAKVATKLALGYTLDEIANDITGGKTPVSFEPSIDYIVTKIPRFDFAKFAPTPDELTTQMRSVGEVMAIGRCFAESLQKALRSLEVGIGGFKSVFSLEELTLLSKTPALAKDERFATHREGVSQRLAKPNSKQILAIGDAFRLSFDLAEVRRLTRIDDWFLFEIKQLIDTEREIIRLMRNEQTRRDITPAHIRQWKRQGFADDYLDAFATDGDGKFIRRQRRQLGIHPVYKRIDTCAGEFPTDTAYLYSSYDEECELRPTDRKKIIILGSGPNRIGQGIEFDYCCVHGVMALREAGFETIMVNCNPETVSTDYDLADRLFFEPLTVENVLELIRCERPYGVIIQFGGQTPLSIARQLQDAGVPIIGTSVDAIDCAESRQRFQRLLQEHGLRQPRNMIIEPTASGGVMSAEVKNKTLRAAADIGYPLVVRPSYVLGGRLMEIVYNEENLAVYLDRNLTFLTGGILLDKFLEDAVEVDVDTVRDETGACLVAGVMEHIERAGIHSGDSACSLPPYSLSSAIVDELKRQACVLAEALQVVGLMNVQFAIYNGQVYVLEVNPRASRTVPFVSKATGVPIAKIAAKAMAGISLEAQEVATETPSPQHFSVKEAVFPFNKFPDVDVLLGPEMKSTGESMGIGDSFPLAFYLAQTAIQPFSRAGTVVFSVRDDDKKEALSYARRFAELGFSLLATSGTAKFFTDNRVKVESVFKFNEGRPDITDEIISGNINIVVNTESASIPSQIAAIKIRRTALISKVTYFTTLAGVAAAVESLSHTANSDRPDVCALQEWYRRV